MIRGNAVSRLASVLRALIILATMVVGTHSQASEIPGLAGGTRGWVAMLIEDHAGMREIVWDGSFRDLEVSGPFKKDHRYAIVTKGATGLVDLGCWDQAWPRGGGWTAPAPMMAVSFTRDGSGAILTAGGKSTWLPVAAAYAGKGTPSATLRGAYLNWLLAHRGTTPSIPRETRWQRICRGAEAVVQDLLARSGSQPEFRVVGIGTSGRLLIPPGEGLQAGLNAVAHMEPSDSGSMPEALNRALETAQKLRASGSCEPGIVLPVGDGWTLNGSCCVGEAYEPSSSYAAMLATVRAIRDSGEAEIWAWSVDGPRVWSKAFGAEGAGRSFSEDAVTDLDAAVKAWMGRRGQPLLLTLAFDQPALTRVAQVTLSIQSNHGLLSATLNGQPIQATGLETKVPITLNEGLNTVIVSATDLCGSQTQASAAITLDTIPPHITLNSLPPALTNQMTLTLQGQVDDPTATLTLDGQPVTLDPQGGFSVPAPLLEGPNTFALVATDPAGNSGRQDIFVVRDSTPPVITLDSPQEGLVTNQRSFLVKGRVDDPTARLLVAGQSLSPAADGSFEVTLTPSEGSQLVVVLATDPAGNSGHVVRSVTLDWTPPVLAWVAPTPAEGAKVTTSSVTVAATVSESAVVQLNGQALTLEGGAPFIAKGSLNPAEGAVVLTLEAMDRAGNTARIERRFDLGLTAPNVIIESPAEGSQTRDGSAVLVGRVEGGEVLKPIQLAMNGIPVPLSLDGRFSLPVQLQEGVNLFKLVATDTFGLQGQVARSLNRFTTSFGVQIDWPLDGLATPESSVEVRGRVRRAGTTADVNGFPVTVDPGTLTFAVVAPLQPGPNTLTARATDGAGNHGQAQVHVVCAPPADPGSTYRWDVPVNTGTSRTRIVHIQGQADLPGVASVKVNGLPMSISGFGKDGKFEGDVPLEAKGRNVLFLEARTLAGASLSERREVSFVPELPRIRLQAPETARPGDTIPVQVTPEVGTHLKTADISWNGRFLARVSDPFAAVTAQVPGDATVGSRILVEALATDAEGEQVAARTYVVVYGQGALLVEAYDDQQGLPLKEGQVAVEGGESQILDATGKVALRTALPQNWIKVSRSGYTPVWRPAGLQVGGVLAAVDARLTPLAESQPVAMGPFTGRFGKGALALAFPSGTFSAEGQVSMTPLSTQGLPGLLPPGWSAISAWWIDLGTLLPARPGTVALTLPSGAPPENLAWVRWDEGLHAWITLMAGLRSADLTNLVIPGAGGFALVVPDSGATMPPMPIQNAQLPAFEGEPWREGLVARGIVDPAILPTTEAIRGARATAKFDLSFENKEPLPSGVLIQADIVESYTLLDSALIEPDGFTQDAVLARWILGVDKDGTPTLKAAQDLSLELPVRMSRTFQENELVDGRIWVGFYHDGVQLAQSGSELLDASGGVISHDGIQLTVPSQALMGTTLFRLNADQGELALLWPELAGLGTLMKSFQLDIVGNVQQGLQLRFEDLGLVPQGILPLLLQRRVVEGERVLVTVGELNSANGEWVLRTPEGSAPVTTGGAFAVILPNQPWDWIAGQVTVPGSVAQPLIQRMGEKARLAPVRLTQSGEKVATLAPSLSTTMDHAVADAMVEAGYLKAVSGANGSFAVPAFLPPSSRLVTLRGERRDLGVRGSLDVPVPSVGQPLRLSQVPFQVMTIAPAEMAEVGVGTVVEILLSTAADPATVGQVKVYQESSDASQVAEVAARQTLSQDGKTLLLTPESPLQLGSAYRVVTTGLASISGEIAPTYTRRFKTQAQPQFLDVDLTRIKLSYPTDTFDVTVTIPEGALPPWAIVEIEALEMGSYASGVMPPKGDLVFNLKANLGERLKITVQLMDGRSLQGTISRYVSADGRTTVGVDGGRVEGPGGLALILPPGALSSPVELAIEPMAALPTVAEGAVLETERLMPGLQIRSQGPVQFLKPPVFEFPASALADGVDTRPGSGDLGNGPLALFRTEKRTLPDGTEDEYSVLMDTADIRDTPQGRKIISYGGLRLPDPVAGTVVASRGFTLSPRSTSASASTSLIASSPSVPQSAPTLALPKQQAQARPKVEGLASNAVLPLTDVSSSYVGIYLWGAWASGLDAPAPEYRYHSGTVYRNWNGLGRCGGTASGTCYGELPAGEVYRYRGTTGLDEARMGRLARGRMLATCDEKGRYLNVGGPFAGNVAAGQTWIALYAVDPRTGETSIDPGAVTAESQGLPFTSRDHSLLITSTANPFDPTLTAPRMKAMMVDATGMSRTMFTVGEQATLRLSTEAGSQPVVRGKVSGSITQDFGTTPAEIPVSFTQEGTWSVAIQGWTAKPVQGNASLSVIVTPASQLGASKLGKPTILSRTPDANEKEVEPSAPVKLTFSEPVRGATAGAFSLKVNGTSVSFRVVSNAQEVVDASSLVQQVWLMPDQRLSLGGTVAVTVFSLILDQDGEALDPVSWSFTVRGADEVGSLLGVGSFSEMVAHKGNLYAVEKIRESLGGNFDIAGSPIQGIRMMDVSDPSRPQLGLLFGGHGSYDPQKSSYYTYLPGDEPFHKHEIRGVRVAQGASIDGVSRDVLLVLTRPRQATELYIWSSDGQNEYRSRHNTIWAFDITGDDASRGELGAPKLLLVSSLGTLTENWGKGLGSAGGMLGVIRLRGGMTIWDGAKWRESLVADAQAAGISQDSLARRARTDKGYYPAPSSIVAANLMGTASGPGPSVLSAVICEGDEGKPWAFAVTGYATGNLLFVDPKVGEPEAKATYVGGGLQGLDGRLTDLTFAVNGEPANLVEAMKGQWQGNNGAETGTLLLAGTQIGTAGRLWVLRPSRGSGTDMGAVQLALADLPARITAITCDPQKMLVGVQAGGRGYIFDLKILTPSAAGPMTLIPIYDFAENGAWVVANGMLVGVEGSVIKRLVIKNLDGVTITPKLGIPMLVDANQFFAGAFYDYNRSVLGDYNPPPQPQMPERLIYALTDMQGKNKDGYPSLRHYYPDLGEMHISGVVNLQDPTQFLDATRDGSPWFMEAVAKLYDGENEVPGSVSIEGLNISGDQRLVAGNGTQRSKIFGNGDPAKEELTPSYKDKDGNILYPAWQPKFAYSPFKFAIKQDVLTRLDQDMRLDFKERFRVKVELKLYKNESQRTQESPEFTLKTFEFAVKFNSNTRLFDVLRGGVWYFDPVVAGSDPANTAFNPFTAQWLNQLVDAKGQPVDYAGIFKTRLSLTHGKLIKKGTTYGGATFNDDMVAQNEDGIAWFGLDVIQKFIENTFLKLRRQIFGIERNTRMAPIGQRFRSVFGDAPMDEKGIVDTSQAADAEGAFGFRMAHSVNAVQMFSVEEAGEARDLNKPASWAVDPTKQLNDKDLEGRDLDIRIRPLVNQHLMNGKDYNSDNMLVNYLVAYPRLQTKALIIDKNGLYPINTILTRDLVVGPIGLSSKGDAFKAQRKAIDDALSTFNTFPSPSDTTFSLEAIKKASGTLEQALLNQQIVTDVLDGDFYNKGVGLLQGGMQERWSPIPTPNDPEYRPGPWNNSHLYVWAEAPKNLNYDTDPGFNQDVQTGIMNHLLKHSGARRVDVFVNGVQNMPEELETSADGLQQQIDKLEGLGNELPDSSKRTPVIAVYNTSAKRYFGGNDNGDSFDTSDLLNGKRETAQPWLRTTNLDAIKLIGVLKGVVQVLWSRDFELKFFTDRLKGENLPSRAWIWGPDGPTDLDIVAEAFAKNAVYSAGAWRDFVEVTPLAPKTKDRIEDEYPVDTSGKTPAQIVVEQKRLFDQAAAAFQPILVAKHLQFHRALIAIEPTLHAHSQGAVVSAVAHSRLGTVPTSRSLSAEQASGLPAGVTVGPGPVDVAKAFRFVSYGGAANMFDWGPTAYFKSYAHHVNERDEVVVAFGMYDPFGSKLGKILAVTAPTRIAVSLNPLVSRLAKRSAAADAIVNDPLNPHFLKIFSGPSIELQKAWNNGTHKVLFHNSPKPWNSDEHNFVKGFLCAVGTEKYVADYPKRGFNVMPTGIIDPMYWIWWSYGNNFNVVTGEAGCPYQFSK